MAGILGGEEPDLAFEVYDGLEVDAPAILYDSDSQLSAISQAKPGRTLENTLTIAQHAWRVRYEATPSFEAAASSLLPLVMTISGSVVGLLLAAMVWVLGTNRARAEELVDQRTAELRRSEAEKSELAEHLAESNKELEQFAYVASHDLQEPARTIQGFLSLITETKQDALDDETKEWFTVAKDGAARMRNLIAEMLEFSRAAGSHLEPEPVGLSSAVKAAWEDVHAQADEAGARLDVAPDLPSVLATKPELHRVLTNLISNGIKYRRKSTPLVVKVTAIREGPMVRVTVADNGIGIPNQDFRKLFVMFARLHSRETYPGNGMGLAICKKLVQRLGGQIGVESKVGQGSKFWFTLPEGPDAAT